MCSCSIPRSRWPKRVASFLMAGFRRGEPLLIVATPEHRELLTRKLEEAGVNVHEAVDGVATRHARRRPNAGEVHAAGRAEPNRVR